jgi:hypothetical protein
MFRDVYLIVLVYTSREEAEKAARGQKRDWGME